VTAKQPYVHVDRVHPHPGNIREDLGDLTEIAASVRAHGVLQPLTVEPYPGEPGHFRIIAGHRRYHAALLAGRDQLPVSVRLPRAGVAYEELMLVENLHRADLNPMDKAEAMGALRDKGYTAARIAASTGLSDATVGFYLALLELAPSARAKVRKGTLSAADAVAAVRRVRKQRRAREGKPEMGGGEWEPDHFTPRHPLAKKATALCDGREHTMRRRVGRLACGECWETVIRADERTVAQALAATSEDTTLRSVS
jgi:ParB family transcriptional regulator, chromosome partitioning protein